MSWRIGPPVNKKKWRAFRLEVFDERGWRCQRCKKAGRLEPHHIRPLHQGGEIFSKGNIEVLCRQCHINHHRKYPPEPKAAWSKLVARFNV